MFVVAGGLFLAAAILPALRGGSLELKFLSPAVVFIIIGLAGVRRRETGPVPGPAGQNR